MSLKPSIPPNKNKNNTLEALKELVEIWKGDRGNKLDRVITFRDLVKGGVFKQTRGNGFALNDAIGDIVEEKPVSVLSNLVATGGFKNVFLTWEGTRQTYYSYTEIFRADTDNLANAILVGTSVSPLFSDATVVSGQTYYYWVRSVSTSGFKSAFNATAGTEATPTLEPDYVISLLEDGISQSELAADVLAPIQSIPTINQTLTDHDSRINTIQTAVNEVLNLPDFDTNTSYLTGDNVKYGGYAWRALQDLTAPSPTPVEGAYWTQIGAYQTYDDLLSANAIAIEDNETRITAAEGSITAQSGQITGLQSSLTTATGNITANSDAIGLLDTRVTDAEGEITSISNELTLLESDITNANNNIVGNAQALGLLDTRVTDAEGQLTAQSSSISQLQNTVDDPTTGLVATSNALSSLSGRVDITENEISTIAEDLDQVEVTLGANTAAIQTKAEASVVADLDNEIQSIVAEYTVKLDVNGYVTGYGFINDGSSSAMVMAADAMYFIDPSQSVTPFDPETDYASMDAARSTQLIFGYAMVEGQQRFVINVPAYIPDGSITTAQISNANISAAQISSLSVDTAQIANTAITTAKIDYAAVTEGRIANAAITNAKIANAAVNNAKIANAAITSAKIGTAAVDTLKIAGNAVTVLQFNAYSGSQWIYDGGRTRIKCATAYVNHGHSSSVTTLIRFRCYIRDDSFTYGYIYFRVNGGSWIYQENAALRVDKPHLTEFLYNLPSGTNTIEAWCSRHAPGASSVPNGSSQWFVEDRAFTFQAAKR